MALGLLHVPEERERRSRRSLWLVPLIAVGLVIVAMLGFFLTVGGGDFGCLGGGGQAGPPPSRAAVSDIPRARLAIYQRAGRRFRIDWTFLASIGAQECDHGSCAGDNGSGCAGPMQISFRRGSPCSPGSGPTLWDTYKVDGDGDGRADIDNPADAVFAAARILRETKGAPPTGGSYAAYRQAACNYYGACADAVANYADQVMARAVEYGFRGAGSPAPSDPDRAQPAPAQQGSGTGCSPAGGPGGTGHFGPVTRLTAPRRLAPLPAFAVAPGFGQLSCDARIVLDVIALVRRYGVAVTACYGIHSLDGEHPVGAAIDAVPRDGDWNRTLRLAHAIGWNEGCALSGVAPACARPPFRFIGYNGYPSHGDPAHCIPCGGGPHLHVSWLTSASPGQPENQQRTSYFAPTWIAAFSTPSGGGDG